MIEQLKNQLGAWGKYTYHNIYLDGELYKGIRNCHNRLNKMFFNPHGRILDLGCNMGGMLWPLRLYYGEAIGVERDKNCLEFCRNLSKVYGVGDKTKFIEHDLNKINELDYLGKFDVIFFLALTQHLENWKNCIKWIHEHGELVFIEFNGQPKQIDEYKEYTRQLRVGLDFIGEYNGRYLYVFYKPQIFGLYQTYKINNASNCDVYYAPLGDLVVKYFKNNSYLNETEWCNKLDCSPHSLFINGNDKVIVQENCGNFLTYWNCPSNYIKQVDDIKKELLDKGCRAEDVELHVKNNKIKIVDLGACTPIRPDDGDYKFSQLDGRIDWEMEFIRFRRLQYLSGKQVTVHNNEGI